MPRIFDILRDKEGENTINQKDKAKEETSKPPLCFPHVKLPDAIQEGKNPEDFLLMSKKLISAVRTGGIDSKDKAREIYNNSLNAVKVLIQKIEHGEDLRAYMDNIYTLLDKVFNQLILGNNILDNIYARNQDEYYLPYHILNILIVSSVIGINMEFNKSGLNQLGLAVIFCDCGMDNFRGITAHPRELTIEEHCSIRNHVFESLKIFDRAGVNNEIVKDIILSHHERVNGEGYPKGKKNDDISLYAKIIGLADTFEAMTNNRPYRQALNAHKAVKLIIGNLKDYFSPDVVRTFIDRMSVYPIGSIVRLDTLELARVIESVPGSPLAPVVAVIQDSQGRAVRGPNIIDLSKGSFPSIQDSVSIN